MSHNIREYDRMLRQLHKMLRELGAESTQLLLPKNDEFERMRLDFKKAATDYQRLNGGLTSENIAELFVAKHAMKVCLTQMVKLVEALQYKLEKKKASPQQRKQLTYKEMEVCNAKRHYRQLLQVQHTSQAEKLAQKAYHIRAQSLKDFLAQGRVPLTEDYDGEEQLDEHEQQIMAELDMVDQQKEVLLDQIIKGLDTTISNTKMINQCLDDTHRKILSNLAYVEQNRDLVDEGQMKLRKGLKFLNKPRCIAIIITMALAGLFGFLIARQYNVQIA